MALCLLKSSGSLFKLHYEELAFDCIIGREGLLAAENKKEGDWATPKGRFAMRGLYYRPDRVPPESLSSVTAFEPVALQEHFGWCDDASHPEYNQLIERPHLGRHEKLWRDDGLYDVIIPLGYNDNPAIKGRGSAIFLHCAEPDKPFTQGCLALAKDDLLLLLNRLDKNPSIQI